VNCGLIDSSERTVSVFGACILSVLCSLLVNITQLSYSDTSAKEDNSFRNHIR
jgi:hypothetical protein